MKRRISDILKRIQKTYSQIISFSLVIVLLLFTGCTKSELTTQTSSDQTSSDQTTSEQTTSTQTTSIDLSTDYTTEIFGVDIISLEIIADENTWQTMLDNATDEEYIKVDVIVNGTRFNDVGIRPKGNSSLSQVASSDSDRYSFRLKFDEYVDGQTCFGLESFVVNNMIGDNTYMKEYISYDLMKTIGVDAPYFGFTNITVNGNPWGLNLAVEVYNDSYEERVFGDTSGMLYNVKMSMDNNKNININNQPQANTQTQNTPDNMNDQNFRNGNFGRGNMPGGMGAGNSGGSLAYSDDNASSYASIFENAVGKSDDDDYTRVIAALKALSTGTDLEQYFDIDAILKYLAAHTFVVNLDSYSSSMAQNYYIYENEGQLTILPWDYNLAWGGFQSSNSTSVVNFPIDTPVSGVELSDRPLLEQLLSNTTYLEQYHSYLQTLVNEYFADDRFKTKIESLDALISEYVKNDSSAFCTFEEYEIAVNAFIELGNLRAESVLGQLNKTVPSTTQEQTDHPELLINSDSVSLADLGTMMDGKNGFQQNGFPQNGFPQYGGEGFPAGGQGFPNDGQNLPGDSQSFPSDDPNSPIPNELNPTDQNTSDTSGTVAP